MATNTVGKDAKEEKAPRVSLPQFVREVRVEASKVTWPTRREWITTTVMVFIMVVISTIFFFGVDSIIAFAVRQFLTI